MHAFKAIVFDFNGVLVDDLLIHVVAYVRVLKAHGVKVSEDDVWRLIHRPAIEKISAFLPSNRRHEADAVLNEKTALYQQLVQEENPLVPGALEVIDRLSKSRRLAIVSNTTRRQLETVLDENARKKFELILTYEDFDKPKPAPDALFYTMEKLGVTPRETAYVGDAESDMAFAKNAGVLAIGVLTKTNSEKELVDAGANQIIKSLEELLEW